MSEIMEQLKVLIIDDQEVNIKLLSAFLGDVYELYTANDGEKGLDIAKSANPDLILLDIMMPGLTGYDVCELLKQDELTINIPIIIITAKNDSDDESKGLAAGAIDYITKPFNATIVKARVKNQLDLRKNHQNLEKLLAMKQDQLIHAEKIASIGQLVAGVSQEISQSMKIFFKEIDTLKGYSNSINQFNHSLQDIKQQYPNVDADFLKDLNQLEQQSILNFVADDLENSLNRFKNSANQINDMVKNLKFFANKTESKWEYCDINSLLDGVVKFLGYQLKYKAKVHKKYMELPLVNANIHQISQVFLNVLMNAVQAIIGYGDITISTYVEENNVVISIQDTGCGIATGDIEQIFDANFTTKKIKEGAGLGLTIAYAILSNCIVVAST
ncbi:MAG: response regulator [Methylococcales bacterium]|nr:response regulator [Methylococcales bacterium]MBT7409493.1 response regulator [Methylococcales bacterium]